MRGLTIQGFASSSDGINSAGINVGSYVATGQFTGGEVSYGDIEVSGNTLQKNEYGLTIAGYTGGDPLLPYGTGTYVLGGYRVVGNLFSSNTQSGAVVSGMAIQATGNRFLSNASDALDISGQGLLVSGNEVGANVGIGIKIMTPSFNPTVCDPKNPNPSPSTVSGNLLHGNGSTGLQAGGTLTVSGNSVTHNTGYGIYLQYGSFTTIAGNQVSGTTFSGGDYVDGTGITAYDGNSLTITGNSVTSNLGDGIFLGFVGSSTVSRNYVLGNSIIGIHLTDGVYNYSLLPNTITQNLALYNATFDARDDTSAPASSAVTYNGTDTYYGDGITTTNIWTKNLFGTTDPVGLSK